ncbi:hypothetical protein, conserved [Eimeria tenella]|uniref:Uncharacterized protein n=1 Tax=Eimeria tenella TaxID=5802 RepID=U6KTX1_EIMTE|nr:hypothetical protein, conserved [Eimeria tenella]CDJ41572.1 hypothetical protein, conserved [Eimeria tenella]|eukprot:XP_013232322.1 hypothetical protein, conserved [Eimeria tenella]
MPCAECLDPACASFLAAHHQQHQELLVLLQDQVLCAQQHRPELVSSPHEESKVQKQSQQKGQTLVEMRGGTYCARCCDNYQGVQREFDGNNRYTPYPVVYSCSLTCGCGISHITSSSGEGEHSRTDSRGLPEVICTAPDSASVPVVLPTKEIQRASAGNSLLRLHRETLRLVRGFSPLAKSFRCTLPVLRQARACLGLPDILDAGVLSTVIAAVQRESNAIRPRSPKHSHLQQREVEGWQHQRQADRHQHDPVGQGTYMTATATCAAARVAAEPESAEDGHVLLPERFQDLLVQESTRRDQQEDSEVPRQQTHFRPLRGGRREELRQQDFTRNHQSGECLLDDNGMSSSSDDLSCDSTGQPHCYGCSRSDSSSNSKRRPGSSGCWQQMAVQLHSLIFGQDLNLQEELLCTAPAAVAPCDKTRSEGPHTMDEANAIGAPGAGFQCTSTAVSPVANSADILHGTAAAPTVSCGVASFRLPQHIAQSHFHQSLTAEVAQQLLNRAALVALETHRHPTEHAQYRHADHYKVQLEQPKLQEQNEQKGWGKGSGSRGGCPCTVSSSRSFCMFLLRLLQDHRAQQQRHERLQLLLLQLVLLLVQQQLACQLCRSDERLFEHTTLFVVQQLQQLLQRSPWSNGHKGQMLPQLFLVLNSLHQQKRLLVLLQLALLLRTWQVDCRSRHDSGVVRVAYLCLLRDGFCYELREAAADILAAGALDELSAAFQRTEIDATCASIARTDVTTVDAVRKTVTGASAVVLCASIAKAATEGNRAAAAAATELLASVACCFLLQQRYAENSLAAGPGESDFVVRRSIREFAAEVAAPALPLLLLLLLPALRQPLVECTTVHGAAATPFSVSLQAAESLHLVRLALNQAQQTELNSQAPQQRHRQVVVKDRQSQPISQHRQQGSSKDLPQERRQFMRKLEEQLMGLLSTALRRCEEQLDVLLPLLRWGCLRGNSILSSKSWTLIEAAAAAVEAPLGYVCVLVHLSKLATTRPAKSSGPTEAPLEEVVGSLVSMLLSFIHACGVGLTEGAKGSSFVEPPAATTVDASLRSAAFGCFSKLLIALTEAARSTCRQIGQAEEAVTATTISEGAASSASALQGCLARGAVALSRFCLELAAAGRPLPQHGQVSDFLNAAADAEGMLLHFSSVRGEVEQQHRHLLPLACELLKLAIESPIVSSKYSNVNYSGVRVSKGGDSSICNCTASCRYGVFTACEASCEHAGEIAKSGTIRDPKGVAPVAGDGAKTAAYGRVLAPVPLSYVAVESIVAVALHAFARCFDRFDHHRVSAGAATAEPSSAIYGNYSGRVPEERTISASATDFAVLILCTAWVQLIGPALWQVCCPPHSSAVLAATAVAVTGRPAAVAAPTTETARGVAMGALSVTTEQQHALAIIESRGSLVTAFSAAIAAVTAASAQTAGPQDSYSKLQQLQQDFLLLLQDATVAAAHIVLCQEKASSRTCCTGRLYESHGGSYWNAAHCQDPVAVLEQLVQALLSHYDNRAIPVQLPPTKRVSCEISCSCCNSNGETSCLWPLMLQVAAAVPSLRSRVLLLFVRLLRRLLAQQRQAEEQQQQQQLVEIWCLLYSFFCAGEAAATVASVERNCGSRGCCCCRMRLSDLLNQDDWVQCSALLLELLELLQQTAREVPCTIAASASAHSHLEKTAVRVNQLAEAEITLRRPPEAE